MEVLEFLPDAQSELINGGGGKPKGMPPSPKCWDPHSGKPGLPIKPWGGFSGISSVKNTYTKIDNTIMNLLTQTVNDGFVAATQNAYSTISVN